MNLLTRDRMSDQTDPGTKRLMADIASAGDTVSTPEYKRALAQQNARDAKRAIGRGWTAMAANMAYDMVDAALAKPRPVEREEPEAFDECTGPCSGGER